MDLCPRLCPTVTVGTTPPSFQHPQPHRPTETCQIPDIDRTTVMSLRPSSTCSTASDHRRGLHSDHQLVSCFSHLEDPESVQSQHGLRQAVTVIHRQGSPSVAAVYSRNRGTTPDLNLGFSDHPHSPLQPEEPVIHLYGGKSPYTESVQPILMDAG